MKKIVILGSLVVALGSVSALILVEVLSDSSDVPPEVKEPPQTEKPKQRVKRRRPKRKPRQKKSEFKIFKVPRDATPRVGVARVNRLAAKLRFRDQPAAWPLRQLKARVGQVGVWPEEPQEIETQAAAMAATLGQRTVAEEARRQARQENIKKAVWQVASRRKLDLVFDAKYVLVRPKFSDMSRPVLRRFNTPEKKKKSKKAE